MSDFISTQAFAWICVACYLLAYASRNPQIARRWWTWAWLALVAHVATAFHFVHHWSHSAAFAHVAQQTELLTGWKSGSGLYLNYLVLLLWGADVAWLWFGHASAPKIWRISWQLFLAFMMFNAAIVFASDPGRWFSLLGLLLVAVVRGVHALKNVELPEIAEPHDRL